MRTSRETDPAFYRPKERRLSELTNSELQLLFDSRAAEIKLDKTFWNNDKIVYWNGMIPKLDALYEIILEIQSRYPKDEVKDFMPLIPVRKDLK